MQTPRSCVSAVRRGSLGYWLTGTSGQQRIHSLRAILPFRLRLIRVCCSLPSLTSSSLRFKLAMALGESLASSSSEALVCGFLDGASTAEVDASGLGVAGSAALLFPPVWRSLTEV